MQISFFLLFLRDARSIVCRHTNTGCRLELHLHGLHYSCRFQTVMQIEKTCCFLSPFFSLSKNHGVRARMRFTGSTDGITSADMTHRPKSICLFSNRPSHGREETSAYHGSNGYVEGGCPQTSCMFHHALSRKGKNERCSRCRVTQIPSTEEVLKCGDVWTEPSVSVATLHPLPHPHFAIQNKHSSLWMCVISLCHNTDRQSPSLTPQRQCKPQHENAALRCSGGKRPKCSEIGIPGR